MIWKTFKLGEICSIKSGNSIPVQKKNELFKNVKGTPYIATKDVGFDGTIDYDNGVNIPQKFIDNFKISPAFSTFVCAEGGSAGRKIAFSDKECCFVNKLFSISPSKNLLPKFLYYFTLSQDFQLQFKNALNGLIGGVSINKIKNFNIKIPQLAEQHHIVDKLDKIFLNISKINLSKVEKENEIDKLKKSILSKILKSKETSTQIQFEKCLKKTNINFKLKKREYLKEGKFPVVSQESELISGYHDNIKNVFHLPKPAVIFGDHTQVLKYIDFDFVVGADGVKILLPIDKIDPKYFYYALKMMMPKNTGYARHYKLLKKLKISVPSIEEQKHIVVQLDKAFAEIEKVKLIINKLKNNYTELKLQILKEEFQQDLVA